MKCKRKTQTLNMKKVNNSRVTGTCAVCVLKRVSLLNVSNWNLYMKNGSIMIPEKVL